MLFSLARQVDYVLCKLSPSVNGLNLVSEQAMLVYKQALEGEYL